MEGLPPPSKLQLTGNVAENQRIFKQQFELYLSAINYEEKSEKAKAVLLLHIIGNDTVEVYNNFVFEDGDNFNLKLIMDRFKVFCIPKCNLTYEQYKFFTCAQRAAETIDQYVTGLRKRSRTCEFGLFTNSLIKDRLVCGIRDNALRERLLRKQDLNFEKALVLCKASEAVSLQAVELFVKNCNANAVKKCEYIKKYNNMSTNPTESKTAFERKKLCDRCVWGYRPNQCPTYSKICNGCGKEDVVITHAMMCQYMIGQCTEHTQDC
ncbi:uncharacterized protein LOC132380195 [Hypanus sabinus]|uniref:uncharacterized protein LOC132380195 n=1 Tax=Hypanus sabinus TaxID=79690 RepID=UPI0028C39E0C|nr:uncharacterized protein LOC132380195 [Hypanus sabinus]